MKKFSKIVAGILLAGMTMLSACTNAEETQYKDPNVYGYLLFAQPLEKVTEQFAQDGLKPPILFDDLNSMVLALQAKKIDVIDCVIQPLAEYIANHNKKLQAVEETDEQWQGNMLLTMGTMQDNIKIYELLNSAITELQANGKLDALQKKYVDAYLQKGKEPKAVTLPKFKDAPVIKIAVTGDNPPLDLITEDGTPTGFNMAMLAEIGKLKKVNIIPVPMNSGARFLSLSKGIVDALFFVDKPVYSDNELTETIAELDVPGSVKTTVPYAKYKIYSVVRK